MAKQIKITLKKDGTMSAETLGIKGKSCADYIKLVEKLVNAKIDNVEYKDEYYQTEYENDYTIQKRNDF